MERNYTNTADALDEEILEVLDILRRCVEQGLVTEGEFRRIRKAYEIYHRESLIVRKYEEKYGLVDELYDDGIILDDSFETTPIEEKTMDIYEYFNSKDVAEHCKSLGRSFTGREMAYLIWQSNHHTLHQKIAAWTELIQTMPDEKHKDFEAAGCCGLHDFLQKYIDRLLQFLADFKQNTGGVIYSYERLYGDSPCRFPDESPLFVSYEHCVAAAAVEATEKSDIVAFRMKKRKIFGEAAAQEGYPMLFLSSRAELMEVHVAPYRGEEDMLVSPFGFYSMFVDIPTPFRRGDIVTGVDPWGIRTGPMVVNELPEENGEDFVDMCANLWDLDAHCRLVCDEFSSSLSLEYYHGELKNHKRFLVALHNHIRGALPLEDLLRSYAMVLLESFKESRIGCFGWEAGMEALAGLDKETILIP